MTYQMIESNEITVLTTSEAYRMGHKPLRPTFHVRVSRDTVNDALYVGIYEQSYMADLDPILLWSGDYWSHCNFAADRFNVAHEILLDILNQAYDRWLERAATADPTPDWQGFDFSRPGDDRSVAEIKNAHDFIHQLLSAELSAKVSEYDGYEFNSVTLDRHIRTREHIVAMRYVSPKVTHRLDTVFVSLEYHEVDGATAYGVAQTFYNRLLAEFLKVNKLGDPISKEQRRRAKVVAALRRQVVKPRRKKLSPNPKIRW